MVEVSPKGSLVLFLDDPRGSMAVQILGITDGAEYQNCFTVDEVVKITGLIRLNPQRLVMPTLSVDLSDGRSAIQILEMQYFTKYNLSMLSKPAEHFMGVVPDLVDI